VRTALSFGDLNPSLESFFEIGDVRDSEDAGKISSDHINRRNQAIATFLILCTKRSPKGVFLEYQL
jgi:hypothetical protein